MTARAARRALLVALALAAPAPLAAQHLDSLQAGARVRLMRRAPQLHVVGTLVRADSVVVVMPQAGGEPAVVVRDESVTVDLSRGPGNRHDGFSRGAKTGAAVGLAVGLVGIGVAYLIERDCVSYCFGTPTAAVLLLPFTGITTVVGGVVGKALARRERWERVWPPR